MCSNLIDFFTGCSNKGVTKLYQRRLETTMRNTSLLRSLFDSYSLLNCMAAGHLCMHCNEFIHLTASLHQHERVPEIFMLLRVILF